MCGNSRNLCYYHDFVEYETTPWLEKSIFSFVFDDDKLRTTGVTCDILMADKKKTYLKALY
jgi:hypothetical protein